MEKWDTVSDLFHIDSITLIPISDKERGKDWNYYQSIMDSKAKIWKKTLPE